MQRRVWIVWAVLAAGLFMTPPAQGFVVINEILADPAAGALGDANADGVRSATDDEFIELLNYSAGTADISGWSLTDAVATRHVFAAAAIVEPYAYWVVFGGGTPSLSGSNWEVASSGALGLNNSGDTLTLFDSEANIIDQVVYDGLAGQDQSIVRFPEGAGSAFVLHSSLEQAQGALFSPGTSVEGRSLARTSGDGQTPAQPTVPELPALVYFALGGAGAFFRKGRQL